LYKKEAKKLVGAIMTSNNNQSENHLIDVDKDNDGYLTIDEVIGLVITMAS